MDERHMLLAKEFLKASGKESCIDYIDIFFCREYFTWLVEREKSKNLFKQLLVDNSIPYRRSDTIEIGKTVLDTVVHTSDESIILSPYMKRMREYFGNRIIPGNLHIGDESLIYSLNSPSKPDILILEKIKYVLTHNPYSLDDLENWENIPSFGKDVIVGMHGSLNDSDKDNKMAYLKELREKLEDFRGVKASYDMYTKDDTFACFVRGTKRR